jgi:hypothetical protein
VARWDRCQVRCDSTALSTAVRVAAISSRSPGPSAATASATGRPAGVFEDGLRVAQVGLDRDRLVVAGQDGAAVQHGDLVDVDVYDPGVPAGLLSDRVNVIHGRDARTHVKELADACRARQVAHRPAQERAVGGHGPARVRPPGKELRGRYLVGVEVVGAAEEVVVHAGDVRPVSMLVLLQVRHSCVSRRSTGGSAITLELCITLMSAHAAAHPSAGSCSRRAGVMVGSRPRGCLSASNGWPSNRVAQQWQKGDW